MYGGKLAFQNRLGWRYGWKETYHFCFVLRDFVFESKFHVQAPRTLFGTLPYTWRGLFSEFCGIQSAPTGNFIPRGSLALPDFPGLFKFRIQNVF